MIPAWALAGASFLAQGQDAPAAERCDQLQASEQQHRFLHGQRAATEDPAEGFVFQDLPTSMMGIRPHRLWLGQYRQFEKIEANRELGEQVRQQESCLRQQRDDSMFSYHAARNHKLAEARGQQANNDQAMRESWTSKMMRASAVKSEQEMNRQKALRQKQAWAANGSRMREQDLLQKRKVFESRSKAEESKRSVAARAKLAAKERLATISVAMEEDAAARRRLYEKLRKDSLPSGALAEAREYVSHQKREAAAEVRRRELAWISDRQRAEEAALERAAQSKASVLSSRAHAHNNRATVVVSRHEQTAALRESLKQLDLERKQMMLASVKLNQQKRDESYEARHASRAATVEMDTSAYGSLVTATRTPQRFELGMTGKQLLEARPLLEISPMASLDQHPLLTMAATTAAGEGRQVHKSAAPHARPKSVATTIVSAAVSASPVATAIVSGAVSASPPQASRDGSEFYDHLGRVRGTQGTGSLDSGAASDGAKKRGTRYKPLLLTVKTVGWTGQGRDAPGTDLTVDVNGVTTVGELKDRIRRRRTAWAGLVALRLMYMGHLVDDKTTVDESWAKSFVVAMEDRPSTDSLLPSPTETAMRSAASNAQSAAVRERLRQTLDANYGRVLGLFRSWDVDRSGTITATELQRALHELGEMSPMEEVDALFASLDQGFDGRIEYRELYRALRPRRQSASVRDLSVEA
jgi:hypothetical protein